jgi:hypothetical protein
LKPAEHDFEKKGEADFARLGVVEAALSASSVPFLPFPFDWAIWIVTSNPVYSCPLISKGSLLAKQFPKPTTANEVRDFHEVPRGENVKVSDKELELGVGLIDRLTSEEFHPEN